MIRAFLAMQLPETLRQEVAHLQSELKTHDADVKWIPVQNLHLTLKFLGNIEENQAAPLTETLKALTSSLSPFTFSLEGIGAFPKTTSPRVVWVGVTEGKEALEELAQGIEEACGKHGFPKEDRAFSPHLTIGRVRSRHGVAGLIKKLQVAEFKGGAPAQATQVVLLQSNLSPKGPIYTPLSEIPLG